MESLLSYFPDSLTGDTAQPPYQLTCSKCCFNKASVYHDAVILTKMLASLGKKKKTNPKLFKNNLPL